jgi:regulator of sirC expression with transglutaminase-like and TPR domain
MTGDPRKDPLRRDDVVPSADALLPARDPFLRAVRCASGRVDILGAALALVLDARPDADVAAIERSLADWGRRLSRRIAHEQARGELLTSTLLLNRLLFEEEGFAGDSESPHDPANTELDLVLSRRRGLPLTLGLLMVEVGKRAGLPLYGISFPGRFLVGLATAPRALLFDPFRSGRLVLPEECQGLLDGVTRPGLRLRPEFLAPCPADRFVERMLTNLKHAYLRKAQIDAAIRVQGRICDLRPDQPAPLQERARLRFQVGRHDEALADLELATTLASDESSRRAVARQLDQVRRWVQAMRWRSGVA